MLLLLTNDDGIDSEGLWSVARRASEMDDLEICIVAPDRERSASGHAISIHHPIEVREHGSGLRRVIAYSASGTPADCVKLAVQGILDRKPDFVISGINRGPNLGTDVFYSGTVSAAMEGALLGISSMAISIAGFENLDYTTAARFAVELAKKSSLPDFPRLVNVNVPAIDGSKIAGVAITRLGVQTYRDAFQKRTDPLGRTWYWLSGTLIENDTIDDTDTCAVRRNLISVTPLLTDLTDLSCAASLSEICPIFPRGF